MQEDKVTVIFCFLAGLSYGYYISRVEIEHPSTGHVMHYTSIYHWNGTLHSEEGNIVDKYHDYLKREEEKEKQESRMERRVRRKREVNSNWLAKPTKPPGKKKNVREGKMSNCVRANTLDPGASITLKCHCATPTWNIEWFRLDKGEETKGEEVTWFAKPMHSEDYGDPQLNRIVIEKNTLTVKDFSGGDVGAYFCAKHGHMSEEDLAFIGPKERFSSGGALMAVWEELRKTEGTGKIVTIFFLDETITKTAKIVERNILSRKPKPVDSVKDRLYNWAMRVEWGSWSECDMCDVKGKQERQGTVYIEKWTKGIPSLPKYLEDILRLYPDGALVHSTLFEPEHPEIKESIDSQIEIKTCKVKCNDSYNQEIYSLRKAIKNEIWDKEKESIEKSFKFESYIKVSFQSGPKTNESFHAATLIHEIEANKPIQLACPRPVFNRPLLQDLEWVNITDPKTAMTEIGIKNRFEGRVTLRPNDLTLYFTKVVPADNGTYECRHGKSRLVEHILLVKTPGRKGSMLVSMMTLVGVSILSYMAFIALDTLKKVTLKPPTPEEIERIKIAFNKKMKEKEEARLEARTEEEVLRDKEEAERREQARLNSKKGQYGEDEALDEENVEDESNAEKISNKDEEEPDVSADKMKVSASGKPGAVKDQSAETRRSGPAVSRESKVSGIGKTDVKEQRAGTRGIIPPESETESEEFDSPKNRMIPKSREGMPMSEVTDESQVSEDVSEVSEEFSEEEMPKYRMIPTAQKDRTVTNFADCTSEVSEEEVSEDEMLKSRLNPRPKGTVAKVADESEVSEDVYTSEISEEEEVADKQRKSKMPKPEPAEGEPGVSEEESWTYKERSALGGLKMDPGLYGMSEAVKTGLEVGNEIKEAKEDQQTPGPKKADQQTAGAKKDQQTPGVKKADQQTAGAKKADQQTAGAKKVAQQTPGAKIDQQTAGVKKAAQQTPGAKKADPQTPGARKADQQTPGVKKDQPTPGAKIDQQTAGAKKAAQQTPGAKKADQQTPGAKNADQQTPGAKKADQQTPGAKKDQQTVGATKADQQTPGAKKADPQTSGAKKADQPTPGAKKDQQTPGAEKDQQTPGAKKDLQKLGDKMSDQQKSGAQTKDKASNAKQTEQKSSGSKKEEPKVSETKKGDKNIPAVVKKEGPSIPDAKKKEPQPSTSAKKGPSTPDAKGASIKKGAEPVAQSKVDTKTQGAKANDPKGSDAKKTEQKVTKKDVPAAAKKAPSSPAKKDKPKSPPAKKAAASKPKPKAKAKPKKKKKK